MSKKGEDWMRHALDWARRGENAPGANGIGSVIVGDGLMLADRRPDAAPHPGPFPRRERGRHSPSPLA